MSEPRRPPEDAQAVFGESMSLALRYSELLIGDGIAHGLLGPRERDRVWERHLINSALMSKLLPLTARVVDIGSGAGLPGLPIAIRRPDLQVDLVESMQRRVNFLNSAVAQLELADRVRVVRGRVESPAVVAMVGSANWVTARAVAPLGRLAVWCLPLLHHGGRLLALKGDHAEAEIRDYAGEVRAAGGVIEDLVDCGIEDGAESTVVPARVVVVRRV